MDYILLILLLVLLATIVYLIKNKSSSGSNELFVQLTNNLSNEIQSIRKEVGENSEKNRLELESKLSKILTFGNGAKNFKNVMKGRVRKFEKALGKGVMDDIKKRTRAYPLIFNR